ncbi:unnamed protein product, partial [Rotaria sp. Silwood1]
LGPSNSLRTYFIDHGFPYRESNNPADFVLDLLIQEARNDRIKTLYEAYLNSSMHNLMINRLKDISYDSNNARVQEEQPFRNIASDLFYVSQRTLRNAIRNSALLAWQNAVAIILAVLTGLLYYQLPQTIGSGVQNRLGGLFFVIVNQIFSTATALEPFIKERALFIHVSIG